MRTLSLVILLAFYCLHTCANDYILVAPKVWRVNVPEQVSLTAVGVTSTETVNVQVLSSGGTIISSTVVQVIINANDGTFQRKDVMVTFPGSEVIGNYNLSASTSSWSNTTVISVIKKDFSFIVETDKPIYKPGGKIFANIYTLDASLKPFAVDFDVTVLSPSEFVMYKQSFIASSSSIASIQYELSDNPQLGQWTIVATSKSGEQGKFNVSVAEYVLPRFDVQISVSKAYLTSSVGEISGTISSTYTFGIGVKGSLKISVYQQNYNYWYRYANCDTCGAPAPAPGGSTGIYSPDTVEAVTVLYTTTITNFDSKYSFSLSTSSELKLLNFQSGGSILLEAVITEQSTGVQQTSQLEVPTTYYDVVLTLVGGETLQVIPGIPTKVTFSALNPDGSRAADATYVVSGWMYSGSSTLPQYTADVTTSNGVGSFTFTAPTETQSISLSVNSKDTTKQNTYWTVPTQLLVSPTKNYLKISGPSSAVDIGSVVTITIDATFPLSDVAYEVIGRGDVLVKGTASANTISFTVPAAASPNCYVVAYAAASGELIASYWSLNVNEKLSNDVSIQLSSSQVEPGQPISVSVKTSPSSNVNLKAVDKAVYLLAGDSSKLSVDRVYNLLDAFSNANPSSSNDVYFAPMMLGGGDAIPAFGMGCMYPYFGFQTLDAAHVFQLSNSVVLSSLSVPNVNPFGDVLMMDGAPIPAAGGGPLSPATTSKSAPSGSVARVRRFFPETWIWESKSSDLIGSANFGSQTAPDSITTYQLSAVSISPVNGIGLAEANVTVLKSFFITMDLPYSVVRGEEFPVKVLVFNYLSTTVSASVTLSFAATDFVLKSSSVTQQVSVSSNGIAVAEFRVEAKRMGIAVSLSASATASTFSDAVEQTLRVKAPGVEQQVIRSLFIDRTSISGTPAEQLFSISLDLNATDVVSDSARLVVSLTGDIMGPSLNNLDRFIQLPGGCGEQNMLSLAPDVYISAYLQANGKFVGDTQQRALRFMVLGYQNELNYRRSDGSFSAFGNTDSSGSSFLSAYVLRVFSQMSTFIAVDPQIITQTKNWLLSTQSTDGSFSPRGTLIHTDMSGGLDGNAKSAAFTAYVLIALLEPAADLPAARQQQPIAKAVAYLESQQTALSSTSYSLALATYALSLGGSSQAATFATQLLSQKQTTTDGLIYWKDLIAQTQETKPDAQYCYWCTARTYDVETAAYALLYFSRVGDKATGSSISKWLLTQRNSFGGFYSSQDTVVGLQALASYAQLTYSSYSPSMSLTFTASADGVSTPLSTTLSIDTTNAIVLQTIEGFDAVLGNPNANLQVKVNGVGVSVVQAVITYNTDEKYVPPLPPVFVLAVDYNQLPNQNQQYDVDACVTYTGKSTSTDMVVLEVGMPTGFSADQSSLNTLIGVQSVKRAEISDDDGSVAIYFDNVVIAEKRCIVFSATKDIAVSNLQPAVSKVYRYYSPQEQGVFQKLVLNGGSNSAAESLMQKSSLALLIAAMMLFLF